MDKKSLTILIVIIFILGGIGIYFYFSNTNNKEENGYEANKTSVTEPLAENTITADQNATEQNKVTENQENTTPKYSEQQLSTFSTTIYSDDSARQNNIQITCNSLNGFIVKHGETFSFCGTVGQSTSAKGYQKADVYDNDGNKKKGLRWR